MVWLPAPARLPLDLHGRGDGGREAPHEHVRARPAAVRGRGHRLSCPLSPHLDAQGLRRPGVQLGHLHPRRERAPVQEPRQEQDRLVGQRLGLQPHLGGGRGHWHRVDLPLRTATGEADHRLGRAEECGWHGVDVWLRGGTLRGPLLPGRLTVAAGRREEGQPGPPHRGQQHHSLPREVRDAGHVRGHHQAVSPGRVGQRVCQGHHILREGDIGLGAHGRRWRLRHPVRRRHGVQHHRLRPARARGVGPQQRAGPAHRGHPRARQRRLRPGSRRLGAPCHHLPDDLPPDAGHEGGRDHILPQRFPLRQPLQAHGALLSTPPVEHDPRGLRRAQLRARRAARGRGPARWREARRHALPLLRRLRAQHDHHEERPHAGGGVGSLSGHQ
mmetsp:Transcript_115565/g.359926  ORF Transcript_115565/g.359926 Transcript_115565/m.359926 type:complete len:386 (+) Transcript_115565:211-1368(+)